MLFRQSIVAICLLLPATIGQQFQFYKYPYHSLGLSDDCVAALNTTVACSDYLYANSAKSLVSAEVMDEVAVEAVCVESCRTSLLSIRSLVASSCGPEDLMEYQSVQYPPTFMADRLIYSYDMSCYKEKGTGRFCDIVLGEWRNDTDSTESHDCEDCMLGPMRLQLESAISYNEEWALDFESRTSSCQATGYDYVSPTQYPTSKISTSSITASVTDTATGTGTGTEAQPTATICDNPYTVVDGDTCEGIAASQNVSSYNLIKENKFDLFCARLPAAGKQICLPFQCTTHLLLAGDGCSSLAEKYEVSRVQLISWNANFDSQCINIERWLGTHVCVSAPWTDEPATAPTPVTTPEPIPTNAATGSNIRCASWYTVVDGDYCAKITVDSSISLNDFSFLNPGVDEECSNLELGTAYCVAAVGEISTYTGYTTTTQTTYFTRPTTTTAPYELPTTTLYANAPSTYSDCSLYVNHFDSTRMEQVYGPNEQYAKMNSCKNIAGRYRISLVNLLQWNPSLSSDNCHLQPNYSYCVKRNYTGSIFSWTPQPTATTTVASSNTETPTATSSSGFPSPTQPGMVETCTEFHLVESGDGCWSIANEYGISLSDFYEWNTEVGTDCTGLWLGYYVCVGV